MDTIDYASPPSAMSSHDVRWRRAQSVGGGHFSKTEDSPYFAAEKRIAWPDRKAPNPKILLHSSYTKKSMKFTYIFLQLV